jgi:hypothetical protein
LFKTNPTFIRNREAYEDGFLELEKLFKYWRDIVNEFKNIS